MGIFLSFKGHVKKGYVHKARRNLWNNFTLSTYYQTIPGHFQLLREEIKKRKKNLQSLTNILAAVALIQTFWYLAVALWKRSKISLTKQNALSPDSADRYTCALGFVILSKPYVWIFIFREIEAPLLFWFQTFETGKCENETESKSNERSLKLIQMLKSWEGSLSERSPDLLSWAEKQV